MQAIRIELNRELDVLKNSLDDMIEILNPGGRLCIITFHSLEDRIVKSAFKKNENPCTCPPDFPVCVCGKVSKGCVVTRKPILPSEEELEYKIVGSTEANSLKGKISNESPVGKALLGKKVGDTVTVETPAGEFSYKVLSIHRAN